MGGLSNSGEFGGAGKCPRVSAGRFGELVSLYLDKEANGAELELLSLLVRSDPDARRVFEESCRIHLATCRMFGKTCVLSKLPGMHMPRRKRISGRRAAFEWTAVAALMFMSFVLFRAANAPAPSNPNLPDPSDMSLLSGAEDDVSISVSDSFVSTDSACSIFSISPKK